MPYGKSKQGNVDVEALKKQVAEQMPNLDLNNLSVDDMKGMILNQINTNPGLNLDASVKEKINKGDIDGLKDDLIGYLKQNPSGDGSSDRIADMLKKNDFEGLKSEVMGMLLKGINTQKKNEINSETDETGDAQSSGAAQTENMLMNMLMNQVMVVNENDQRVILLNAIKPFLSDNRQKGIDECMKVMGFVGFFEKMIGKAGG